VAEVEAAVHVQFEFADAAEDADALLLLTNFLLKAG